MTNKKPKFSKQKITGIPKPYLRGKALSLLAAKRGGRILVYLLISMVLFFFLGQLMVVGAAWLRLLVNLAVIAIFCMLLFSDGGRAGEGDVAFAEIALARKEAGKSISQQDLARCYHPWKGFFTAICGALLPFLLCLFYAMIASPERYMLGALPSWLSGYEQQADVGLALQYYHQRQSLALSDLLRLPVRLLVFPFVNLFSGDAKAIFLVERLSPVLVLIAPLFYGLGYLRGEHYRALVHGGIAEGQRKKARKIRQEKSRRSKPTAPKQLV